jgi:hypothetical protein
MTTATIGTWSPVQYETEVRIEKATWPAWQPLDRKAVAEPRKAGAGGRMAVREYADDLRILADS